MEVEKKYSLLLGSVDCNFGENTCVIISWSEVIRLLGSVVCIGAPASWWIIFCYIVLLCLICGVLPLDHLAFSGWYRKKVIDLLFGWRNWVVKHLSDIWNMVSLCLMWTIWREQNFMFEDAETIGTHLWGLFTSSLFDWSHVWGFITTNSISKFIKSLSLCTLFFLAVII